VLAALALLLAAAPLALALAGGGPDRAPATTTSLSDIAAGAGCRLTEYDADPRSNPPVSGRVDERISAADGSYVGRRAPSEQAAVHALLHGRVVIQYRRDLPAAQVAMLDRLVRAAPARALLFANSTHMAQLVAATAYLTLLTCPRVDARTIATLRAFRARRASFGQGF
jgi:hypothetical protein